MNKTIISPEYLGEMDKPIYMNNIRDDSPAYDIDYIRNDQITGPMCEARNSMPLDELNFGMGDIFIRLAN